jgi:RNA 3'-terminal phosphate cyclase (ATP)
MSQELIKLDGNVGNGSGQVVRIAVCLSALYRIPVEIRNIRVRVAKSGLGEQHLRGVNLVKEMCNAEVTGAYIGSTCLTFKPGLLQNKNEEYLANIKTAGCVCLLIQIALPCALFSSRAATYILKGGTNVPLAPQIEYFNNVLRPLLKRFGADFRLDVVKRGLYPDGGGEVRMHVTPIHHLNGIELMEPGVPADIKGLSFVAGYVNINEAKKMTNDATSNIVQKLSKLAIPVPPINIITYKEPRNSVVGNGSGINLMCKTTTNCIFGGSGLMLVDNKNRIKLSPALIAANDILNPIFINSCVDQYLQDQMIIFMVLAKGPSKVNIGRCGFTSFTETVKQVAEIMLKSKGLSFSLNEAENGSYILECNGLGLTNNFLN